MLAVRPEKAKPEVKMADPAIIEIQTLRELKGALDRTEGGVILDFYGNFCGPCRTFAPQYESWAKEFQGKITFAKVNVEKAEALCQLYQIHVIPTLVVLDKEGKVVRKSSGSVEIAELGKKLDKVRDSPEINPMVFK